MVLLTFSDGKQINVEPHILKYLKTIHHCIEDTQNLSFNITDDFPDFINYDNLKIIIDFCSLYEILKKSHDLKSIIDFYEKNINDSPQILMASDYLNVGIIFKYSFFHKCITEDNKYIIFLNNIDIFVVDKYVIKMMKLFDDFDSSIKIIPIYCEFLTKDIMKNILIYCDYYHNKEEEKIFYSTNYDPKTTMVSDSAWDKEYFSKYSIKELEQIMNGTNFLNMPGFIERGSKYIGETYILGKTAEEIRTVMNLPDNLTY